jgi:transposase InsO family protein
VPARADESALGFRLPALGSELWALYFCTVGDTGDLVHHSDRGMQYLSFAETVIGLFKTEVIRRRQPWRSLEAVEFATLAWADWFNHRRLLEPIGDLPPAEY